MKCPSCKHDTVIKEETEIKNIFSYICMNCGFMSNDVITRKNKMDLPNDSKLITELSFYESDDENAKLWYPSVFVHERGMVFPEGDSSFNWKWVFVPIIKLTEEESKEEKYSGFKTRLAYENKIEYDRFEFSYALENLSKISKDLGVK